MKRIALIAICLLVIPVMGFAKNSGANDRVQIGKSIEVGPDETVGDAVCIGCSIRVQGHVMGDAVAIGGAVDVDSKVNGDAVAIGGSVRLGPDSSVGGDVTTVGGAVQRDSTSSVGGDVVVNHHLPVMSGMMGMGTLFLMGLVASIPLTIILSVICYFILGQQRVEVMVGALRARTGPAMLAGLAVLIGAAIVMFLFPHAGTLKPIVVVVIAIAVCITMIVGYTAVSMWAGRGVAKGASPIAALILGAIVVAVAQSIPLIGFFLVIVFALAAVGTAITTGFGTHSDWLRTSSQ
jgi:hypothetical protein